MSFSSLTASPWAAGKEMILAFVRVALAEEYQAEDSPHFPFSHPAALLYVLGVSKMVDSNISDTDLPAASFFFS